MEVTGSFGWLEEEGQVLLDANWRTFGGAPILCWDLPGGGVEAGESLEETCRREIREETGLEVRVRDLAFVVERFGFRSEDPDRRSRFFFFHVERTPGTDSPLRPLDPEIVDAGFRRVGDLAAICDQPYHRQIHEWLAGARERRYFVDVCHPERRRIAIGRAETGQT